MSKFQKGDLVRVERHRTHFSKFGIVATVHSTWGGFVEVEFPDGSGSQVIMPDECKLAKQAMRKREVRDE